MISITKRKSNGKIESMYEINIPYLEDLLSRADRMLMFFQDKQLKEDRNRANIDDSIERDRKKRMGMI